MLHHHLLQGGGAAGLSQVCGYRSLGLVLRMRGMCMLLPTPETSCWLWVQLRIRQQSYITKHNVPSPEKAQLGQYNRFLTCYVMATHMISIAEQKASSNYCLVLFVKILSRLRTQELALRVASCFAVPPRPSAAAVPAGGCWTSAHPEPAVKAGDTVVAIADCPAVEVQSLSKLAWRAMRCPWQSLHLSEFSEFHNGTCMSMRKHDGIIR